MRFLIDVSRFVFSLNMNKTKRLNNDDVKKLLKFCAMIVFKKSKFFKINVLQFVCWLNEKKANKSNGWFAKISMKFQMVFDLFFH